MSGTHIPAEPGTKYLEVRAGRIVRHAVIAWWFYDLPMALPVIALGLPLPGDVPGAVEHPDGSVSWPHNRQIYPDAAAWLRAAVPSPPSPLEDLL